ncbi:Ubiquitin carboxyl-terminal hydrolase CYLD [Orchesella cincta]|uniref:Ubiquitin carboxyl-terminal hydrolase CYLD n=1 Tax=Orchesella cincta TaxID=48709 RepID=A0A1D2MJ92_ORCCI|nr:Ubiquitin carboxyl-terminal hydrolase CYLD [Orchesella cincta]
MDKSSDPVLSTNIQLDLQISMHEGNEDLNKTCLTQQSVTNTAISSDDFPILESTSTTIDAGSDFVAACLENANEHLEQLTHSQINYSNGMDEINVDPINFKTDSQVHESTSLIFDQPHLPKESDQTLSVNESISTEPSKKTKGKRKRRGCKRSLSTDQNTEDSQSKRKHTDLATQLEGQELNVSNPFVAMFNGILIPKPEDSPYASQCRKYLRENIVMPLRKKYYCSAENAMKLRTHLSKLDDDILGSFMDVEQLLYLLFDDALKEREFIQYSDGVGDFMHQTSIDNTDKSTSITVQTNLETSMRLNGNLKFQSVPNPALIIGLPRSNGKFVQYSTVIPSVELDISSIIVPAVCSLCHQTADWEKVDRKNIENPEPCCDICSERHASTNLDNTRVIVSRNKMRLVAVISVRASHFTAFIRNTMGTNEWLFFDSMAGEDQRSPHPFSCGRWRNFLTPIWLKFGGATLRVRLLLLQIRNLRIKNVPSTKFSAKSASRSLRHPSANLKGWGLYVKAVNNLDKWLEMVIIKLLENPNRAYQRDNDRDSFLKMRSCCDGHMCIYEQICYPRLYPLNSN